jgi:hypothetical protein
MNVSSHDDFQKSNAVPIFEKQCSMERQPCRAGGKMRWMMTMKKEIWRIPGIFLT